MPTKPVPLDCIYYYIANIPDKYLTYKNFSTVCMSGAGHEKKDNRTASAINKASNLPGLEVIKLFSCSTQLSITFFHLKNVEHV